MISGKSACLNTSLHVRNKVAVDTCFGDGPGAYGDTIHATGKDRVTTFEPDSMGQARVCAYGMRALPLAPTSSVRGPRFDIGCPNPSTTQPLSNLHKQGADNGQATQWHAVVDSVGLADALSESSKCLERGNHASLSLFGYPWVSLCV